MKKKKLLASLVLGLLALLPSLSFAQPAADTRTFSAVVLGYDLDSTSYQYPVMGPLILGPGQITSSGSSATWTAGTGSAAPFAPIGVGDRITIPEGAVGNAAVTRTVTAKASNISITVDSAADISGGGATGVSFYYRDFSVGTAVTNGWFPVKLPGISFGVQIAVEQLNVTGGIDFRIECRAAQEAEAVSHHYRNVTVAGMGTATGASDTGRYFVEILPHFESCRVGMKIGTGDDGGDLTTNAEIINVYTVTY